MVRKALVLVVIAIVSLMLTSCSDQQEITELAAIVGLGFGAGSRSPSDWSELEPQWEEIHPQITVSVESTVRVQTTGSDSSS